HAAAGRAREAGPQPESRRRAAEPRRTCEHVTVAGRTGGAVPKYLLRVRRGGSSDLLLRLSNARSREPRARAHWLMTLAVEALPVALRLRVCDRCGARNSSGSSGLIWPARCR